MYRRVVLAAFLASAVPAVQMSSDARGADYLRTVGYYRVPDIDVIDANGHVINVRAALRDRTPIIMQFMFTTCSGICPISTELLAAAQSKLETDHLDLRLWSVSIDPEVDTPDRLQLYAQSLDAPPNWQFFTGRLHDIVAFQKAFSAYRGNKMRHEPLTFIRIDGDQWVRLNGFLSASELASEYRRAIRRETTSN